MRQSSHFFTGNAYRTQKNTTNPTVSNNLCNLILNIHLSKRPFSIRFVSQLSKYIVLIFALLTL